MIKGWCFLWRSKDAWFNEWINKDSRDADPIRIVVKTDYCSPRKGRRRRRRRDVIKHSAMFIVSDNQKGRREQAWVTVRA